MKKILGILSIFLIITFVGCEEFLIEESETSFTTSTLFETTEGLEKMVIALYDYERGLMQRGNANGFLGAVLFSERQTDLSLFLTGDDANLSRYTSPGPTSNIRGLLYSPFWSHRYYIIGRTNEIIHYGQQLGDEANGIVAEASFWRAYCYYTLFARFSNLYLSTEPISKDNLESMAYVPADSTALFNLMYQDLQTAIRGLSFTPANNMAGRVTKATAHHLMALVAAWGKDWQTVAAHVDSLDINASHLMLVGDPANIFNKSDLSSSETLWALKYSNERGGGRGHRIGSQSVNVISEEAYTHQKSGNTTIIYNLENLGRQWALALPNSYLMSLYHQTDLRLNAYYKRHYTYQNPDMLPVIPTAQQMVDRDTGVSYYTTNNFSGQTYQTRIGDTIYGRDVFMASRVKMDRRRLLPSSLKMADIWSKPLDTDGPYASFKDIMVYRLAESYLLGAEAYMHIGDQAKASYYYNKTWTRAGHPSESAPITFDLIRDEHARELAFEGRRWEFLKRTGTWYAQMISYAGDFTKYPGSSSPYNVASYGTSDGRDPKFAPNVEYYFDFNGSDNDVLVRFNVMPFHVNWPIPQDQIDAMGPSNFPQNPGY
jgi:starch-binding outer membrane protein, SusD/RagB family